MPSAPRVQNVLSRLYATFARRADGTARHGVGLAHPAAALALAGALLAVPPAAGADGPPERGTLESVRGCTLSYQVHRPADVEAAPTVVLAHGYMRDGTSLAGWAGAIVAAGLTAVTVDLCASSAVDGRHADNGADLVALRRALGVRDVLYLGVSAGGLAALVAASEDAEATRGLLLLDPVNAGGQARRAAGRVRAPAAALVAKSQVCNAWRNIDDALATLPDATIVRVPHASHCDFEWPTDRFCRIACLATNSQDERERAEERIRSLGVAFLRAAADGRPEAMAGWRSGVASP